MKTFLITGYPRSRTAWLSNFLTYGPSFCFHEPGTQKSVESFPKFFGQVGTEFVGVSEARAVIYFPRYMELFPDTKVVVIRRNKDDVIKSLKKYNFDFVPDFYDEKLAEIAKHGIEVDFEPMPLVDIWKHCLPGVPMNWIRTRMLERCCVQLTPFYVEMHRTPTPFI